MLLEERIREWQQNVLNSYCFQCSDTCCNPKKHRIMLDYYSLPLFQEKGIPVIKTGKLDKSSLETNQLLFRNGSKVQKPALVQMPKWLFGKEWYLYADYCPFYKENKCEIHEDSRRPEVCKRYPIIFRESTDPEGKKLNVKIRNTCEYFNKEEIRNYLTEKFPVRIID